MVNRMETLAAKVPPDLSDRIEEYRERHGLNKSQAIRRLIEDGFESDELQQELEERRRHDERTISITKPAAVSIVGWFLVAMDWLTVAEGQPVGWFGLAVILAAIGYGLVARRD